MQLTETLVCMAFITALTALALCYIGREYLRLSAEWGKVKQEWADISKAWAEIDAERGLLKISANTPGEQKNAD